MRLLSLLTMFLLMLPLPARAQLDDELVLSADEPFGVWINGVPISLALTTATVDHVTLNDAAVPQLRLSPAPRDRIANLNIGGAVALVGRHGKGLVAFADKLFRQELYWFPGASLLPADGSIGPFAFPADRVTLRWGVGDTRPYAWQLSGGIDRAPYGVASAGNRLFVFAADVRMRRPLPVVSASTGADLAEVLGGRLVGPTWQEEIVMGLRRPVRRLQLDRPLLIGPMSFTAVAVRVGGARDGTRFLSPNQKPVPDADADPAETLVRGRTAVGRAVARMIVLSRNHLEAQGCIGLTVAKRQRRFILHCAPAKSPLPDGEVTTAAVPLLPRAQPADALAPLPVMAAGDWLDLAADAPLAARILGEPVELMLDGGLPRFVFVNEATVARMAIKQADFAGSFRQGDTAVPLMAVVGVGVGVHVADRTGAQVVAWVPGRPASEDDLADGVIDVAALPHQRVRVRLPTVATSLVPLTLPMARAELLVPAGGQVRLPGLRRFVLRSGLREQMSLPVADSLLAAALMARLGGQWAGAAEPTMLKFGARGWLRRLQLARPLQIGPLRFDAVAVETTATGDLPVTPRRPGMRAPEPSLELSRRQLAEQGCASLAIDRQARLWRLDCAGLPSSAANVPPTGSPDGA